MRRRKTLKNKLNVLKVNRKLIHQDDGRYIAFCDYRWHRGIVKDKEICEQRECRHYRKLYIP